MAAENQIHFLTWRPDPPWIWDQAVADFEARNPGVKIVREVGPHSSSAFHDLVTQKLKNRDPRMDVFFMDVIWPAEFASAGWAMPLDGFFPAAEREQFLIAPISANTYEKKIYGVPVFVDAGMLYYRNDLLLKYGFAPPGTWPELVRQAKIILAKENDPHLVGYSGQFKQYEGLVCNMMEFVLSNGGSLWNEKELKASLDSSKAKDAVRFVRDHIIGDISQRGVLAYEEPDSLALFTQGRALFHRNWPYAWEASGDARRSKVAGRVGIVPLPVFPGGSKVATLGGWQLGDQPLFAQTGTGVEIYLFHDKCRDAKTDCPRHRARARPQGALPGRRDPQEKSPVQIAIRYFRTGRSSTANAGLCSPIEYHAALF